MSFVGGMMPIERPCVSASNSPFVSPAGSRRSSVSSVASAHTDPGLDVLERLRKLSTISQTSHTSKASVDSTSSSKSGFKTLFGKSKKPKAKKDYDKIVLTSRHAAAVRTKMMLDPKLRSKPQTKTAGVVGTIKSGHLTAAVQEARHPHSGPPALHGQNDMPMLTRIISGDERDEEDELDRNQRLRWEWEASKRPVFAKVVEHESDESAQTSADVSADEDEADVCEPVLSPIEKAMKMAELRRPSPVTRNSQGTRFHKDDKGLWRR